jgi:hypothetical protein
VIVINSAAINSMDRRMRKALLLSLVAILLVGSGGDGLRRYTVSGKVMYEGKPLFSDHKTQVDFPKDDYEWNVNVPKTGQSKVMDAR